MEKVSMLIIIPIVVRGIFYLFYPTVDTTPELPYHHIQYDFELNKGIQPKSMSEMRQQIYKKNFGGLDDYIEERKKGYKISEDGRFIIYDVATEEGEGIVFLEEKKNK